MKSNLKPVNNSLIDRSFSLSIIKDGEVYTGLVNTVNNKLIIYNKMNYKNLISQLPKIGI